MSIARIFETVLPSAARTASPADQTVSIPGQAVGLKLTIDVTAIVTTPSITVTIKGVDPVSGTEYDILASSAITAVGVTVLEVGPGFPSVANESESEILPEEVVVNVAHADADSITYSVSAFII